MIGRFEGRTVETPRMVRVDIDLINSDPSGWTLRDFLIANGLDVKRRICREYDIAGGCFWYWQEIEE